MLIRTVINLRWDQVEKDSVELNVPANHYEPYNLTDGKSRKWTCQNHSMLASVDEWILLQAAPT